MEAEFLTMSTKELDRLYILQRVCDRRLKAVEASRILGITPRQMRRLVERFKQSGAAGLISRSRGKPSNNRLPEALSREAIDCVRRRYSDFGPTFAAEKLREVHQVKISVESLRGLMIAEGLWTPRNLRDARVQQPRQRRACIGELIQIDGCDHDWFEDRAPRCSTLAFIDDATSRIMELRFVESESTFEYFAATRNYLAAHGKPAAFYSDKHSVFRVNTNTAAAGTGITQFARALADLQIGLICANTPAAKGRVERAHATMQDRLVKELRLAGICSRQAANAFAPQFVADYNRRFGKAARSEHNAHRELLATENLDDIFCWQEERSLRPNLTLRYDRVQYLIKPTPENLPLRKQRVTVFEFVDGHIEIRAGKRILEHQIGYQEVPVRQADVVGHKRLGTILGLIREEQLAQPKRDPVGPTRHAAQLGGRSD